MSFIGEAALSAFLELLSGKFVDSLLNFVANHRQVHQQLKQWQSILPEIKAVLNHAEEKQIKDEGVKIWLDDLQDLAYDVDDILDEFAYQQLRLKLQKTQAQASTSKVQKLIPTCCTGANFSPTSFMFYTKTISKIKDITDKLNKNSLNTRRSATAKGKKPRLQPTSLMDGTVEYVGRANEKQEMLELLKSNNSDGVCVLSIVGMGGMGKTTLAQLVYNDTSIKECFDHKAWVCVSDDFDAVNITKTILKSIDAGSHDDNDFNLLQVKLKEKLSGKRFLLVLDDIWNESYTDWTILRAPFGAGTKIIVTTRLEKVSSNVDSVKAFKLDKLSHHDCLSIFAQHALKARNFDGHLRFKELGENIVRRCNGLPLAAKALGSLLRTVKDDSEWEKVYESEIWDLPEDPCGLIPALRLSYHYLPPHLKRCFAYCSIFPKDYEFEEEQIILLWRAEGFLQAKAKCQAKGLGNQYFQDLVSRSFFQISSKDKSCFMMHDLMNDLAQLVAGEICCKLEEDKQPKFSHRSPYSSYVFNGRCHSVKKFEAFYGMTFLRTFLPLIPPQIHMAFGLTNVVLDDLLPRLRYLRVLSLCGYVIYDLPDFFENLKHLRYLNLSRTPICPELQSHKKVKQLIIANYGGAKFSTWIGNPSFQNLSSLKLRNCKNCKSLPSVGRLPLLKDLSIFGFDQVQKIGVEFFGENELNPFASLEILSFVSLPNWKEWDSCEGDEKVLKSPNLHKLSINACPQLLGRLPTHVSSLQILEIDGCRSLVVSISSFPTLCELSIRGCAEVVDDRSSPANEVSSLQTLSLSNISKFNIPADRIMLRFGNSEHFRIVGWEELASLSQHGLSFVGHRFITIEYCPQLHSLETEEAKLQPDKISHVESLVIGGCDRLNRLPKFLLELTFLTVMKIYHCLGLVSFAGNNLPPNLKKLHILGCTNLEYLVDEIEDNKSMSSTLCLLEDLKIEWCGSLMSLSLKGHKNICNQLQCLQITHCLKLSCLFSNIMFPITLKHLKIDGCPELEYIAEEFEETACLESIRIESSGIKSLPRRLDKLFHLQEIRLRKCSNLVSFEESELLSINLRAFSADGCGNVGALPKCMVSITSLRHLCVFDCSADILFPSEGFPANLTSLEISNAPKIYRSLVEWGLNRLTSLQHLVIGGGGCSNVNLEFMFSGGFQDLASLQELMIDNCPKLTSLPEKDMLLCLDVLHIFNCPLLKEECSSDKGREWSKISHIPCVRIDGKVVIPRQSD
ncbi:hypothetical protein ES319_A04G046800v1 [Gossypium barbadense]|uniref:Disease resistance RPP13-like protein 1 n=1 Tax=Gossypium barbadense TaxID=3634 RepID=A0A5J5W2Q1_GOSBA|nr:hypothetical protein ES319_A04G046800v1 [Gossypium barbadense]